jgi:glutamyl-tRNA synthetase
MRVEDLDPDRSRPALAQAQLDDLRWLGLPWDEGPDEGGAYGPYVQSERQAFYDTALARLIADGRVYPCYCSRAELRAVASAPHGAEGRTYYPGTCRTLSAAERTQRERAGRKPSLRVRLPDEPTVIRFRDLCQGVVEEDVALAGGDFVVRRADGVYAYQLAVVVDDALMGITDVIRGADLLDSTARQIWLHRVLGWREPRFGHVPLLVGRDGHRLSKRHASLSVAQLRAGDVTAAHIVGTLAYLAGVIEHPEPTTPCDLVGALDLKRLSQQQIVVDDDDIIMQRPGAVPA